MKHVCLRIFAFVRMWFHELGGDWRLGIDTAGRDESRADRHHQPYEPTPYLVLERLAASGYISSESVLVDYGCGKGRVPLFFACRIGCRAIGIESEKSYFEAAIENQENAIMKRQEGNAIRCSRNSGQHDGAGKQKRGFSMAEATFLCQSAETWTVPPEADRFFFFNPFSVETLQEVLALVQKAYDAAPRQTLLFFYYPSEKFTAYLKNVEGFSLLDDIDCTDIFRDGDQRERILVYGVGRL